MNARTEIALIVVPWVAFLCGLLVFCAWRDTQLFAPVNDQNAPLVR